VAPYLISSYVHRHRDHDHVGVRQVHALVDVEGVHAGDPDHRRAKLHRSSLHFLSGCGRVGVLVAFHGDGPIDLGNAGHGLLAPLERLVVVRAREDVAVEAASDLRRFDVDELFARPFRQHSLHLRLLSP